MTYTPTQRFSEVLPKQYSYYARQKDIDLAATDNGEDYFNVQAARKTLLQSIPNLGETGADELLLKLGSWLNERKR